MLLFRSPNFPYEVPGIVRFYKDDGNVCVRFDHKAYANSSMARDSYGLKVSGTKQD